MSGPVIDRTSVSVTLLTPTHHQHHVHFSPSRLYSPSYSATLKIAPLPLGITPTHVLVVNVLPSLTPSALLSIVNVAHSIKYPLGMLSAFGFVTSVINSSTPSRPSSATWRVSSAVWKAQVFVALNLRTKKRVAMVWLESRV